MEKKITIKRMGCIVAILIFLSFPAFIIGELYYYLKLDRNYIKVDEYKTITIWKNCIIFERYWFPFYPKDNCIFVKSTWDFYDVSFTITNDSVLGIWSNYPIEVYRMDEFKAIEIFEKDEREDWVNQYSFANVAEDRKDSLQLEFNYELWYPAYLQKATYTYKSGDSIVSRGFSSTRRE